MAAPMVAPSTHQDVVAGECDESAGADRARVNERDGARLRLENGVSDLNRCIDTATKGIDVEDDRGGIGDCVSMARRTKAARPSSTVRSMATTTTLLPEGASRGNGCTSACVFVLGAGLIARARFVLVVGLLTQRHPGRRTDITNGD